MPPELTQPQEHPNEPLLEAQLVQSAQIGEETNGLLEAIIAQGEQNNPEPILEAQLEQSIVNTDKIVESLKPTAEATSKMAAFLSAMKGEKGDSPTDKELLTLIEPLIPVVKDGETPTDERLLELIEPLIPVVYDGIDGETPSDEKIVLLIKPLIPKVKDGETPTEKELVALIKPLIPKVVDGKTPVKGKDYFTKNEVDEVIDTVADKVSRDVANQLASKASKTYSVSELEGMQNATTGQVPTKQADGSWAPATGGSGGGHVIEDEGIPLTQRATINFTGAGVTAIDAGGKTVVTIPGGGGSGFTELVATGAVNGSNLVYTFIQVPTYIVADGVWFKSTLKNGTVAWTNVTTTVTMVNPPTFDIFGVA